MAKAMIAKVQCVAKGENGFSCGTALRKTEMYVDALGYFWCEDHKHRGELIQWAANHHYPAIRFDRFAIGVEGGSDNQMLYEVAAVVGRDEMIWEALSYVNTLDSSADDIDAAVGA
jgi:hypothetical protein